MDLAKIKIKAEADLEGVDSVVKLDSFKSHYLSRKGVLSQLLKSVKDQPAESRSQFGAEANLFKQKVIAQVSELEKKIKKPLSATSFAVIPDPTIPGTTQEVGHWHPMTIFQKKINNIFRQLGYQFVEGTDVETVANNFDLLNIPQNHPARDSHDTFFMQGAPNLLLRTQTSAVQVQAMLSRKPPVKLFSIGRVYRNEATDASHEAVFTQCEALVIAPKLGLPDLLGTLELFLELVFGEGTKTKVIPAFFPFVEPGLEVHVSGFKRANQTSQDEWLEVLGAGLVHPKVLRNMKIDPDKYQGFAFGLGLERLLMISCGVPDIRLLLSGDVRLSKQFN